VGIEYDDVGGSGINLRPALIYGHDVSGWSCDYAFIQGRQSVLFSLDADFTRQLYANLTYSQSRGGQFNIRPGYGLRPRKRRLQVLKPRRPERYFPGRLQPDIARNGGDLAQPPSP